MGVNLRGAKRLRRSSLAKSAGRQFDATAARRANKRRRAVNKRRRAVNMATPGGGGQFVVRRHRAAPPPKTPSTPKLVLAAFQSPATIDFGEQHPDKEAVKTLVLSCPADAKRSATVEVVRTPTNVAARFEGGAQSITIKRRHVAPLDGYRLGAALEARGDVRGRPHDFDRRAPLRVRRAAQDQRLDGLFIGMLLAEVDGRGALKRG